MTAKEPELFKTRVIRAQKNTGKLFEEVFEKTDGPVVCLGKEFENDNARREYFTEKLQDKLKKHEFRQIEGFPFGEDANILKLSDPPYYTACPNPWINDFIEEWEAEKPEKPEDFHYHREPFAADVKEGKNDPIYNAHSYHTKVPHKAIMRYILHYTEPGDIVFDGFCGTGMTGVAAQMCGDRCVVESLGYRVTKDGTILQQKASESGKLTWEVFSRLGARKAVLNDLSSAATFIAYNYNTPVDIGGFEKKAKQILLEVEKECGWIYETLHTDSKTKGKINYTVWSDVFICPDCAGEVIFWEAAVDKKTGKVLDLFSCPQCRAELTKRKVERAWITKYDSALNETIKQVKQVPVLINYSINGKKNRFEKYPDAADVSLIRKIENSDIPYPFSKDAIPKGDKTCEPLRIGISHIHHFYTKRNLWMFSALFSKINDPLLYCALLGGYTVGLKTARFLPLRWIKKDTGPMKPHTTGTLYIPSLNGEQNWGNIFTARISASKRAQSILPTPQKMNIFSTNAFFKDKKQSASIDYIFLDPPFGSNLSYSELNDFWESWLGVKTNNKLEAIENKTQSKGAKEYLSLMTACFVEAYRILKAGRWMTVEFSNTNASVWNSIQTALTKAGFIIANISALNKKQGSFNAVTNPTSVKQDLVISAYKPNGGFTERFKSEAASEKGVWDFVQTHLKYLPVIKETGAYYQAKKTTGRDMDSDKMKPRLQAVLERDPRILYDQVVSYYVRNNMAVPISSTEFQQGLESRFILRDGMYFLSEQAAVYDKKRLVCQPAQEVDLFVSDEASAIQWLRTSLDKKSQTFSELNAPFMQQLGGWNKNELQLDLRQLLHDNFLCYNGRDRVPEKIHAYLSSNYKNLRNLEKDDPQLMEKAKYHWYVPDPNKAGDLEKLREKSLLKEFEQYKQTTKKLKVFRLEAVRAGFKKAWQEKEYHLIIQVAEKIPNKILEEDQKLLMWYDQALTRSQG
jgi:DNA modification methylase